MRESKNQAERKSNQKEMGTFDYFQWHWLAIGRKYISRNIQNTYVALRAIIDAFASVVCLSVCVSVCACENCDTFVIDTVALSFFSYVFKLN